MERRLITILTVFLLGFASAEWVQLPSLDPSPPAPSPSANPDTPSLDKDAKESSANSSKPSVAEHFISEMTLAHQRLRATLWPNKQEPRTIKEKLHYLSSLRNHILNNIARTMFGLNSEDAGRNLKRQKRGTGWGGGDHSEIGFPSLEVALLTLAFLVFAVFLVNMVLVLFSNIFGTTTTGTSQALGKRKKREAEQKNEEAAQIMQAIDEFPLRHRQKSAQCYADPNTPCQADDSTVPQIARFLLDLKI